MMPDLTNEWQRPFESHDIDTRKVTFGTSAGEAGR
jgi:hypothetical protein